MNEYNIFGAIVDSDSDKWSSGDITLSDFCSYINELKDGDEVSFVFNSPGGSVTTGVAMANKIRALKDRGIKTTARVEGVCASIATVMMCACDEIIVSKGSFVMIHNCWAVVQGDANTLRKEADLMEKMNEAILSFYRSKFNATDEQLKQWMDDETWISSDDVDDFGLKCRVEDFGTSYQIAASISRYDFKHIPRGLTKMEKKTIEEIAKVGDEVLAETLAQTVVVSQDETTNEEEEKEEEVAKEDESSDEDQPTEEPSTSDEPKEDEEVLNKDEVLAKFTEYEKQIEDLRNECAGLKQANEELQKKLDECEKPKEETVTKDECEKRISGVQSSFQHKINDLTEQFNLKDKELMTAKGEISSLNEKLEKSQKELSEMVASLEEKTLALASLNAAVNAPSEELPTMKDGLAMCATPAEKVAFLRAGRFVR